MHPGSGRGSMSFRLTGFQSRARWMSEFCSRCPLRECKTFINCERRNGSSGRGLDMPVEGLDFLGQNEPDPGPVHPGAELGYRVRAFADF
jgi:hypothetical protein